MAGNLANNYAFIKTSYPDYDVFYNINVTYIRTLSSIDKVLFLCKQEKNVLTALHYNPTENNTSTNVNLDLTGSPLKDNCVLDSIDTSLAINLVDDADTPWSKTEECYVGINVQKAKQILSNVLFESNDNSSEETFWILCDATDENKTLLLEIGFNPKWNTRGIVSYTGSIPVKNVNMADMVNIHTSRLKGANKIESVFDCYFNVATSTTLKLNWTSSSLQPTLNNFKDCDVTLYQEFEIGNTNSVAEHFWRQLLILSIIKDDIIDFKKNEDEEKEPVYRCGSGIEMNILQDKIMSIMTEVNGNYCEISESDTCEIEQVIEKTKERASMDVTDKLWDLMKFCSSYKDLKTAFAFLFQCAAKCNVVNMPSNQNRLAEIIREISQHRLAVPCLTGSEPLELLLEVGLEKLFKDYEYIFSESKICGAKELQLNKRESLPKTADPAATSVRKSLYGAIQKSSDTTQRKTLLHTNIAGDSSVDAEIIGFQNSRFCKNDIDNKIKKLAQIHLILEHVLLIHNNLNIENIYNDITGKLLKEPLRKFEDLKKMHSDKLEIPITTDKILHRLENKDPHARRITMSSENKFKKISTTFYYSMDSIFPSNTFVGLQNDDKDIAKNNMYYCYEYTRIHTNRC